MPAGGTIWPKWMLKPCANASELPASRFGAIAVGRAFELADHDGDAAVAEVLRVRVALAAEADDRHGLALDQGTVGVFVVVHAGSPPLDGLPGRG
jgi:hypothetical protein